MGFGQEMKDFAAGFEVGMKLTRNRAAARKELAEAKIAEGPNKDDLAGIPDGEGGGGSKLAESGGGGGGGGGAPQVAWNAASPEQKALLNTISGPESGGAYDILYGGKKFSDYSKHPGVYTTITSGPNKGQKSSAAGKYQFLESTWNRLAKNYHLEDFSPENQDKAAWYLAAEEYGNRVGRDLNADLKSGDPKILAGIGPALRHQWTSLPGGIEQGTTTDKFVSAFTNNLNAASQGGDTAVASKEGEGALPERPVYTSDTNVASVKGQLNPKLDRVVQQAAADNPGLFALNPYTHAAKRTPEQQKEMVDKGYSGTLKSKHVEGKGVDIVPINPDTGQPDPDYKEGYSKVTEAMRRAAEKVGVSDLKWGGDWNQPDLPHWQVSMLQQQQLEPGGISPPRDQEVQPAMFAASGGAIPEPTQNFQAGGAPVPNPAGTPDKYNAGRAFTQALPTTPASTFTPRRVGAPPAYAPTAAGAPSSSQQKFRDYQAGAAARAAAAAAARAQPAAQPAGDWQTAMGYQQQADALKRQAMTPRNVGGSSRGSGPTPNWAAAKAYNAYQTDVQAAKKAGQNPFMIDPSKYSLMARQGRFAEGGVIPEIGYARGGAVEDRDATFQRLLREETRPGSSRDDGGQGARDRAAKRLSHLEGRATSSAYSPAKDTEYFKPAKRSKTPKGGGTGKPYPDKTKTSSTDKPIEEDRATRFREHEITDLNEDRATRFRAPQAGLSRNPYDLESGIPNPRAAEMADRQPRAPGAPLVPAAGTPTAGYDPKAQPAGTPTQGYEPIPGPFPGRPEPDPRVGWDPYRNPPQNVSTSPTPDVPVPLAERFAPQIPIEPDINAAEAQERLRQEWLLRQPSMARGGVIPEADEEPISPRAESAGYTTSAPASAATRPAPAAPPTEEPAEQPKADLQATPKLLQDVNEAVRGGARFLTRHFGLDGQGDGAMPTPKSQAGREDGIRRFASGEGAATPDEINGIDDKVDPNRELNEGDRHMTRLAKTAQWYLMHGEKDKAEAVSAGLMQYGAQRFSKLGSLSQAAYSKYMQTKNPEDMEAAAKYLEKAYDLIPDGGKMNITIDPETGMLQAIRTDADGKDETYDIKPEEIPGLIQQAQSASGYWQQIFRLSDPQAALQKERQEFEVTQKTGERKYEEGRESEKRAYEEGQTKEERDYEEKKTLREEEREAKRKAAEDKAAAEAEVSKEQRAHDRAIELKLMEEALKNRKPGDATIDEVSPVLSAAAQAKKALEADEDNEELKAARDEAASRLFDVVQDPAKMEKLGFSADDYTYTGKVAQANVVDAQGKPVEITGEPRLGKDGIWYGMGPNGKWIKLRKQDQPAAAP